ncbi:MAG: PDZ domain-containing protein, partial [Chitinophagaceae bacterium]
MKQTWNKVAVLSICFALLAPVYLFAQKGEKDKEKKEVQQIIITRKGDKEGKVIIEVDGENVKINGKTLDELKDKNGDISVRLNKLKDIESLTYLRSPGGKGFTFNQGENGFQFFGEDENRAMLGVSTQKAAEGAEVQSVTKESAAEKIGLKENDIITRIDDKKIESPEDLSEAIKAHKPGDKVSVTFLRDKKEQKKTAELTKWKGMKMFGGTTPGQNFKFDMGDMDFEKIMPKIQNMPGLKAPMGGQGWNWSGNGPKLGISIQDIDEGKGVKVIEVDEDSNADKAKIKMGDIITHIDDKGVNGVDEVTKLF